MAVSLLGFSEIDMEDDGTLHVHCPHGPLARVLEARS